MQKHVLQTNRPMRGVYTQHNQVQKGSASNTDGNGSVSRRRQINSEPSGDTLLFNALWLTTSLNAADEYPTSASTSKVTHHFSTVPRPCKRMVRLQPLTFCYRGEKKQNALVCVYFNKTSHNRLGRCKALDTARVPLQNGVKWGNQVFFWWNICMCRGNHFSIKMAN